MTTDKCPQVRIAELERRVSILEGQLADERAERIAQDGALAAQPVAVERSREVLLLKALDNCIGCIKAAEFEGLSEALTETSDERLKDLIERRLLWVRNYAEEAVSEYRSAPPAQAMPSEIAAERQAAQQQIEAWQAVCELLDKLSPDWQMRGEKTGLKNALAAIENLATQAQHAVVDLDAHTDYENFISEAIDRAPEPLKRLGEWLAKVLDDDHWPTAERMLLGAAFSAEQHAARALTAPPAQAMQGKARCPYPDVCARSECSGHCKPVSAMPQGKAQAMPVVPADLLERAIVWLAEYDDVYSCDLEPDDLPDLRETIAKLRALAAPSSQEREGVV